MGNSLNPMQAMAAEQQRKMAESQAKMITRQLEMQQEMRERMIATQIAMARDMFMFSGTTIGLLLTGLVARAAHSGDRRLLIPAIPLTAVLLYQYDMAYHTKMDRIQHMAEGILKNETHMLRLPGGDLTIESLDANYAMRAAATAVKAAEPAPAAAAPQHR